MQKLIKLLVTFFGIGYLPRMPGTYASLCGAGIIVLLRHHPAVYWGMTAAITLSGFLFCGRGEQAFGEKDPSKVVIDEVSGMLISCLFMPFSWVNLALAFFFFRFFDIVKPFPLFRIQRLKGSAGIMLDDIGAAMYTWLGLLLAGNILRWIASR
ncbi:MAG: phosphatidylglycerophosphatase A [Candidatus Omnitrophica bacterium]|nr:phosphatidylglycerophosphatase A [Candidatus Omnitrophota bacterium]